jgi:putative transposase
MHVRQRGNDAQDCFRTERDRLVYLVILRELCLKTRCALHAYCLMTNHVHLLLTPPAEQACATLMRDLGQRYVQYFNRRHKRTGTLWEGRFRSCLVESREYVLGCYRYIEMNPVEAGMVDRPSRYRWSSHLGNTGGAANKLLTPHVEYAALAEEPAARPAAYLRLFEGPQDRDLLKAIRAATYGGYPLIGEELKSKLSASGCRIEPGKAGRPSKDPAENLDQLSLELGL